MSPVEGRPILGLIQRLIPARLRAGCVGALAGYIGVLAGCIGGPDDQRTAGGSGMQTTGELIVTGKVRLEDESFGEGIAVRLVQVRLTPSGTAFSAHWEGVSDSLGRYHFRGVPKGRYVLMAADTATGRMAMAMGIRARVEKTADTLFPFDIRLHPTVTLRGRLLLPASLLPSALVCLPGLGDCRPLGADSTYTLPAAPVGEQDLIFIAGNMANYLPMRIPGGTADTLYVQDVAFATRPDGGARLYSFYDQALQNSFSVLPQPYPAGAAPAWYGGKDFSGLRYQIPTAEGHVDYDLEDYSLWPRRRFLGVNTTALGPQGLWPKLDFPLLVRLTSADFDFSQARGEGQDIRFSLPSGRHLAYEIERWDPAGGAAEIWVNLDTLYGMDSAQGLFLHWGKPEAPSRSDGALVFHPFNAARAVWHLDDSAAGGFVREARGLHHGSLEGAGRQPVTTRSRSAAGVAGRGLAFDGVSHRIVIPHHPDLDVGRQMTLSLWARNDAPTFPGTQSLINKWDEGGRAWSLTLTGEGYLVLNIGGPDGRWKCRWRSGTGLARLDLWHHFSVTFDGGRVRMYVDGEETASAPVEGAPPETIPTHKSDILLGARSVDGTDNWQGRLDQVEYHSAIHSPEWLKLNFLTQGSNP